VYPLYVLLTYLLAPIVMIAEGWKALRHAEYRGRLSQRLGFVEPLAGPGTVWVHAVSVGEVQAAAGLVRALQRRYPDRPFVVTTVTPTGAAQARKLFGDSVRQCYLPYDLPGAVRRFLDRVRPDVAIILETEIWPTLYRELGRRGIPLVMASARVSARSVSRYRRMAGLFSDTLSHGLLIGAQSAADADRFRAIGAAPDRVSVTGNVKFDMEIPGSTIEAGRELRARFAAGRPVWIAGSTHEGEEEAALAAHDRLLQQQPEALLILVPRHPQRFEAVRGLLRRRGLRFAQRSLGEEPSSTQPVFLVDTLGELQMFYAASDVAFVGGSLVPVGGHNLLEPAVLGLPVLSGPYTQNAQEIADLLAASGALLIVQDEAGLARALVDLLSSPTLARETGEKGRRAMAQSRGAVERLVALVEPLLSPQACRGPQAAAPASSERR
jgi:3-deoxy-D-manno-octulosonic-acid transferase